MKSIELTQEYYDETQAANLTLELAMLLAGTLLVAFSAGRWLAPLAAWIGPALIMRFSRDHRIGRGYPLVVAAYILAFLIAFGAMWMTWGPLMAVGLAVGYAFLWSLPYLADRLLMARLPGFLGTFVYPLAAATLELVNNQVNPIGAWGATGFTQYGILPIMQLASLTGMIGITFLMAWFASFANWAWENRDRRRELVRGLAAFGAVVALVFIFGFLRLNLAPAGETAETIRVAGITAQGLSVMGEQIAGLPDADDARLVLQAHQDAYFEQTAREAQAGAQLVIWPEVNAPTFTPDEAALVDRAREVARENGIYLALPLQTIDPETSQPLENKLMVIDSKGDKAFEHIKYGGGIFENTRIGDGKLQAVPTPFGTLSGIICWDMDYPEVVQQAGVNGTGLMLVPSRDWADIDPIHTHMAVFRAIENGMSVVRQTDQGLSIAVDPYGRVLAQTDYFTAKDRTMIAQVPTGHVTTFYTMIGRRLDWLFLIGFLFIIGWAFVAGRRVK